MDERRFAERYSERIVACGVVPIPQLLITYQGALGLSSNELVLVLNVLQHRWTDKWPFVAIDDVATAAGVSHDRVRAWKQSLEAKGFLVCRQRTVDRHSERTGRHFVARGADEFDLSPLFAALERCAFGEMVERDTRSSKRRAGGLPAGRYTDPDDHGMPPKQHRRLKKRSGENARASDGERSGENATAKTAKRGGVFTSNGVVKTPRNGVVKMQRNGVVKTPPDSEPTSDAEPGSDAEAPENRSPAVARSTSERAPNEDEISTTTNGHVARAAPPGRTAPTSVALSVNQRQVALPEPNVVRFPGWRCGRCRQSVDINGAGHASTCPDEYLYPLSSGFQRELQVAVNA